MLDDLNKLTRSYEIYITSYIENQNVQNRLQIIDELSVDRVLSFNYTDTYERLYGNAKTSIEYDYIHGKARRDSTIDTCNLVLGIDEYLKGESKNVDNEFIEFKKFYQRVFKKTGCQYKSWFGKRNEFIKHNPNISAPGLNIYIYGHSLDVTDGDVIADLIRQERSATTIYYHNKKALGNQISNLVKILGEEDLINRTGSYKPSIVFKEIA